MSGVAWRNISLTIAAFIFATACGVAGFRLPAIPCAIAPTAITAISIIFGLSLALINMGSRPAQISAAYIPNKTHRDWAESEVNRQNSRLILRQKALLTVFLLAVAFGLAFLAAQAATGINIYTRLLGGFFTFLASLSICYSFFLPFNLSHISRRDQEFWAG